MGIIGNSCSCLFACFSGICKLIAWIILLIAIILKIIGIYLIKNNPAGSSDSSDRKRITGICLILTAVVLIIVGLITCCFAYQLKICKRCLQGKSKSKGGKQQVIIIKTAPAPPPAPQKPQYVPEPPPAPVPHYISPQHPSTVLPVPQFLSQPDPKYGPSAPPVDSQFVLGPQMNQQYDLSQPSQNPNFMPLPQHGLQHPSGQFVYPPPQTQYNPVLYPTPYPNQQQSSSGPSDVYPPQQPPSYDQTATMPSAPPADDNAYNPQY